jgi:hypothetical protein
MVSKVRELAMSLFFLPPCKSIFIIHIGGEK